MKDQNRNQKAPETKLTDEQLGDVNAGLARINQCPPCAKQEGRTTVGLAAGAKVVVGLDVSNDERTYCSGR